MQRPRVDECHEPSLRARAWLRVDELEPGLPKSGHLLANVLAREREMMESLSPALDEPWRGTPSSRVRVRGHSQGDDQSLSPALDEPCDHAIRSEGLEELDA